MDSITKIMSMECLRVKPDGTQADNLSQKLQDESLKLSKLSLEEIAELFRERCTCWYCGALMLPRWEAGWRPGRETLIFPEWHGCEAQVAAQALSQECSAQERTDHAKAEQAKAIERAGLVGWLGGATFETFGWRADWREVIDIAVRAELYTERLLSSELGDKNWLVLCGNYGTGKTHLAAAILHRAIDAGWLAVRFRVWTDYLLRIQKSYNANDPEAEIEADIVKELQTGRLVVIDDLDKRRSEFTRRTLFSVLNHRYNANLPTVLTFNHKVTDLDPLAPGRLMLQDFLSAAVLDRLTERAFDVIEFNGPSFRSGAELPADNGRAK